VHLIIKITSISYLPPSHVDPRVQGLKVIIILSSRATYRPPPLGRYLSAAAMTVMSSLGVMPAAPEFTETAHNSGTVRWQIEDLPRGWSMVSRECKAASQ